ncbi:MAG: hypothetical protein ACLUOI_11935 [Eisenbergiella sp.]
MWVTVHLPHFQAAKGQTGGRSFSSGKGNAELGWWWHTPEDTMANVDPENFKEMHPFSVHI